MYTAWIANTVKAWKLLRGAPSVVLVGAQRGTGAPRMTTTGAASYVATDGNSRGFVAESKTDDVLRVRRRELLGRVENILLVWPQSIISHS